MKLLPILCQLILLLPAFAAERVALVIGNAFYDPAKARDAAPNLITSVNDAADVAALLKQTLGFKVIERRDATLNQMAEAVEEFKKEAADAKVVIVYFAGHGVESAALGDNFLLPVQARLEKEAHLRTEAFPLKSLVIDVQKTSAITRLIILDCCRNNPLEGRAWSSARGGSGLRAVDTGTLDETTMVVFSAAPGKPAKDRLQPTDRNSPFAEVLLTRLKDPGKSCAQLFGEVENEVFASTGGQQHPKTFINGNLAPFTTFVFRAAPPSQLDPALAAKLIEMEKKLAEMEKSGNTSKAEAEALKAQLNSLRPPTPLPADLSKGYTNTLGMKFVPVAGTPVLFCIHETRSKDFAVFIADKKRGYTMKGDDADDWRVDSIENLPVGRGSNERAEESSHPVCNVSWRDAAAFCEWLSRKEGKKYRLPTDEEWSKAVLLKQRTGPPHELPPVKDVYPWEGKFVITEIIGNYSDRSLREKIQDWTDDWGESADYRDGFPTTAPVMSFRANSNGLYDMGGNVWEWCTGDFGGKDPEGKDSSIEDRVLRGASWIESNSVRMQSSRREDDVPTERFMDHGFRLVLEGER